MGLDIARSLAKRGIPVYGIDSDRSVPGRHSKYCRFVQGPDPRIDDGAHYVQFLVDFAKRLDHKAVLYPLSDMHVLICSRHRAVLRDGYEYVMPDHDTVERVLTKDRLYTAAMECGIPAPRTVRFCDATDVEATASSLRYPVILKPTESTYWQTLEMTRLLRRGLLGARAKVILCHNPDELRQTYRRIAEFDPRLVVQEVIPGEDSRLAYFSFYLDRQSRVLGLFAGRKYRVIPTGFGSASYVRSLYDPELAEIGLRLLRATDYRGLGGIEFKKDARDGCYKLIEFNARFGMWDALGVRCGVDLPYLAYCDALYLPVEPQLIYREGVIWVDWQRDIRAAIAYWRKGELSLSDWLRSLQGEKMCAIYSKDDWRPGIAFSFALADRLWERIRQR